MKKYLYTISLLILSLLLSSCTQRYTKIEELARIHPGKKPIVGISPDAKYVFSYSLKEMGAYSIDIKPGDSVPDFEPVMKLEMDTNIYYSSYLKKLLWMPDGQSFILADVLYPSITLAGFREKNIGLFTMKEGSLSVQQITHDERFPDYTLKTGRFAYAPSFSYDGKAVLYSAHGYDSGVYKRWIIRHDIQTGEETVIYEAEAGRSSFDCLEVSPGIFICIANNETVGELNDIFIIENNKISMKMEDELLRLDVDSAYYDIKSWAEDRKTLLLIRLMRDPATNKISHDFFIMRINKAPEDYTLTHYPVDDGYTIQNAMLSPDGSYIISCEKKSGEDGEANERKLVLYTVSTGKKTTLYASDEVFGSTLRSFSPETIHIMRDGKLLIGFQDGEKLFHYRLYQLK